MVGDWPKTDEDRARLIGCEVDMLLPLGRTCSECVWFAGCERLFGCRPTSTSCDWSPGRFRTTKPVSLLSRIKTWLEHPRASTGVTLMREVEAELTRLHALAEYLDEPATLLAIPRPHRMRISELLHGSKP